MMKRSLCQAPSCALISSKVMKSSWRIRVAIRKIVSPSSSLSSLVCPYCIVFQHSHRTWDPSILPTPRRKKKIKKDIWLFFSLNFSLVFQKKKKKVFCVCVCQNLTWQPLEWVSEWERNGKIPFWRCVNNNPNNTARWCWQTRQDGTCRGRMMNRNERRRNCI